MNRLFFERFYFTLYEFGELLGLGQFDEVLGDKELGVEAGGCVFDHFGAGACAKEDADGRVVAGGHLGVAVAGDAGVELAEVFADAPVAFDGFGFVKEALEGIGDGKKFRYMGERKVSD